MALQRSILQTSEDKLLELTECLLKVLKNCIPNQRVAASREVKSNFGTAQFPEGQGAVERLVQEVKKILKSITNNHSMSIGELDTALAEATYLVNCRPLQPNPTMGEDGFICPNDILMSRSDKLPGIEELYSSLSSDRMNLPCLQTSTPDLILLS